MWIPRPVLFTSPLPTVGWINEGPVGTSHKASGSSLGPRAHDKRPERCPWGVRWLPCPKLRQGVPADSLAGTTGSIFPSVLFLPVRARFQAEVSDTCNPDPRDERAGSSLQHFGILFNQGSRFLLHSVLFFYG